MIKKLSALIIFFSIFFSINAQELNAHVMVSAQQLGTSVDQTVFKNLQDKITSFLNNRKWTKDNFALQEKIECNFSINIISSVSQDVYKAQLIVQAARPVFNSVYLSPLVNFQDADFVFKFQPFQQLDFNDTRIAGIDALASNLTAVLAYYANIIIGFDYDSFKEEAGVSYFRQAMNIVTAAPQSGDIKGWQAFDGLRNRYWLANNLNDAKLKSIHHIFYQYFRSGLDSLYDNAASANTNILSALTDFEKLNVSNPNTMIEQFFVEGRNSEFSGIFKNATPDIKSQALQTLILLDPNSADKYNNALK